MGVQTGLRNGVACGGHRSPWAKQHVFPTALSRQKGVILTKFRVVDLRTTIETDKVVEASTPEGAAAAALGEKVIRGGQNLRRIICRVYWEDGAGRKTMVRLYRPMEDAEAKSH